MATNLLRSLQKTNLIRRQQKLGSKFQTRNGSTSSGSTVNNTVSTGGGGNVKPLEVPGPTAKSSAGGIPLAVGISLGVSLTLLTHEKIIKKIFPEPEPVREKVTPGVDPKLVEQLISHDRKVNQLETQLALLRDDIREKNQQATTQAANQVPQNRGGNIFELSEVIEANNLANMAKHQRELELQRQHLVREHSLQVEGEILKVENKYKPIINKIRELESHLEAQRQAQLKEAPARLLWISCQSLLDRLRYAPQEPLEEDPAYSVLKKFAANDNQLAMSILDSIPAKALKEGVQSEEILMERFSRIEKVCKRVALVGAHGGNLTRYLVSYLQSLFIFDNIKVTEDEVAGRQLVDPSSWNTYDILARVRYCLSNHNLEQAVRYANQLRGQARVVARDWIRDARIHLITRQAFTALSTHAEAIAVDSVRENFATNE